MIREHAAGIPEGHRDPQNRIFAVALGLSRNSRRAWITRNIGGAPLLGVKGVCIICHGRSDANAMKNAIRVAADFASSNMNQRIEEELREFAKAG